MYGGGACQWNICVDVRVKCSGSRGCIFNWFFIICVGAVCRKAQPFKNYCKYCRRRDHDGAGTCIYAYTVSADIEIGWYDGWSNYADDPGVAFVNAIRDIADSDFLSGTVRMIDAILVFVYIAIGVGFTLSVYNNMIGGLVL